MPMFMLRFRDRKNIVVLDSSTECRSASDALSEACGALRSLVNKNRGLIDPNGRLDVEDQRGRIVARLLLAEELKAY